MYACTCIFKFNNLISHKDLNTERSIYILLPHFNKEVFGCIKSNCEKK